MIKKILICVLITCTCSATALTLSGCFSKDIPVGGKYYSTSLDGVQICFEFDNHQVRLSSNLNTGPWRDYKREGNTIKVTGMNQDGSKSTLTIKILDENTIEAKNLIEDQDIRLRKH